MGLSVRRAKTCEKSEDSSSIHGNVAVNGMVVHNAVDSIDVNDVHRTYVKSRAARDTAAGSTMWQKSQREKTNGVATGRC